MYGSFGRTPLVRRTRRLMLIRVGGLTALLVSAVLLWSDPAVLALVAGAVLLVTVTALYLVECRYAQALERALVRNGEWRDAWSSRTIPRS